MKAHTSRFFKITKIFKGYREATSFTPKKVFDTRSITFHYVLPVVVFSITIEQITVTTDSPIGIHMQMWHVELHLYYISWGLFYFICVFPGLWWNYKDQTTEKSFTLWFFSIWLVIVLSLFYFVSI